MENVNSLTERVISTLKFFDLQDYPLTLLEVGKYLIADLGEIKKQLNEQWELEAVGDKNYNDDDNGGRVGSEEILKCLETECAGEVESFCGFYFLKGRKEIVEKRLSGYFYGIQREKLAKKYARFLRFIPFVRGVALGGSQSLGLQKETSDIDLLIFTDPEFMWVTRTLVTGYFQLFGKRRHGQKIANRFCLNHYIGAPREVQEHRNLYTAEEYLRLRPLVYPGLVYRFQFNNKIWIGKFFPNAEFFRPELEERAFGQKFFEFLLSNSFGRFVDKKLKDWQLPKIRVGEKFIVVKEDELSFHPDSKQQGLLYKFFGGDK